MNDTPGTPETTLEPGTPEMPGTPGPTAPSTRSGRLFEIATLFLRLGCLSFGGPVAHLGSLRTACVEQRRWLSDDDYADLVALCQFLPGPASSQVVFGIGMVRGGLAGALLASLCFLLPSAVIMIGGAVAVQYLGDVREAGWLHGLKLVAVAVVAQAVWSMGTQLCPDRARRTLAVAAMTTTLLLPSPATPALVVAGAMAWGYAWRGPSNATPPPSRPPVGTRTAGAIAVAVCAALVVGLPVASHLSSSREVELFSGFFRAGALVFGGGHVVLPMLRSVAATVDDSTFLAGYGLAQALPGPLFAFAGFLGACLVPHAPWAGGALALVAIFLPAWLLVGGALPFWQELRARPWAVGVLRGANAAVVGVLLAALYTPVCTSSVQAPIDVAIVCVAYGLLTWWRWPPWLVVSGCAGVGALVG